jgi:hypothetical protein
MDAIEWNAVKLQWFLGWVLLRRKNSTCFGIYDENLQDFVARKTRGGQVRKEKRKQNVRNKT